MADLYGLLLEDLFRGRPPRIPRPFNPDHLLWRAGEHGLLGLAWQAVERWRGRLPEELRLLAPRLKALTQAQEALVRMRLEAAREVAGAFEREGIPAVFVKGVALSVEAYPTLGLRPFSDLDVLVSAADFARAGAALGQIGFRPSPSGGAGSMERAYHRQGAPGGLAVDLHRDFVEREGSLAAVRIPVPEVLGRRRRFLQVPIPATEDLLLLAAANLVRSRVDRLILIADFDRLARLGPDWEAVEHRARQWRLRGALWLGLEFAERLFGPAAPAAALRGLLPPAWRAAALCRFLGHEALWTRRKFKQKALTALLPYVCLDSVGDMASGLLARTTRKPDASPD